MDNKEVSLDDLKKSQQEEINKDEIIRRANAGSGFKAVNASDILPKRENQHDRAHNQQALFDEVDKAFDRVKKEYIQEVREEQQKIEEQKIEHQIEQASNPNGYDEDEVRSIIGDNVKPIEVDPNTGHLIKDPNNFPEVDKDFLDDLKNDNSSFSLEMEDSKVHNKIDMEEINMENQDQKVTSTQEVVKNNDQNRAALQEQEQRVYQEPQKAILKNPDETQTNQEYQVQQTTTNYAIDKNDFKDILESDDDDEDPDKEIEKTSKLIAEKINPISKPLDLSNVQVVDTPIAISNALLDYAKHKNVSDWIIYADRKRFSMEEFSATEIDDLNSSPNMRRSRYNTFMDVYTSIFNHIVGLNKIMTVKEWLKSTKFFSTDDIWFGVYKSSFERSNIIPRPCPKCGKVHISEHKIMDLVKPKNQQVRKTIMDIFQEGEGVSKPSYDIIRVQISDKFAVDLREPSIYNIIFENAILDDAFRQKYANLLTTIAYIDKMYVIRTKNGKVCLQPIAEKEYPNNEYKTVKHRVFTLASMLALLSTDEKAILSSNINSIINLHDEISYVLPEVTCEHCKQIIPEEVKTAEQLVFIRQGLAELANFSQK